MHFFMVDSKLANVGLLNRTKTKKNRKYNFRNCVTCNIFYVSSLSYNFAEVTKSTKNFQNFVLKASRIVWQRTNDKYSLFWS